MKVLNENWCDNLIRLKRQCKVIGNKRKSNSFLRFVLHFKNNRGKLINVALLKATKTVR